MFVKFDPPLGELYWAIDKQKPQDYYSFGIISKPKAYQKPRPKAPKSPTSIDSEPLAEVGLSAKSGIFCNILTIFLPGAF